MERYKVTTCEGYTITDVSSSGGKNAIGLTATVLDTWYAHREVRSYRSETRVGAKGRSLGHDGARRAAEAYAKWLNSN